MKNLIIDMEKGYTREEIEEIFLKVIDGDHHPDCMEYNPELHNNKLYWFCRPNNENDIIIFLQSVSTPESFSTELWKIPQNDKKSNSKDQKLLCVKEYPGTFAKDWKRIHKFNNETYGTIRVFENKKINKFITIFEDNGETIIWKSKLSNQPSDYIFGVGEEKIFGQIFATSFIQPKYGDDAYDQECILDFSVENSTKLGFDEIIEAYYSYDPNHEVCHNAKTLKERLIELGLEHNPELDWKND